MFKNIQRLQEEETLPNSFHQANITLMSKPKISLKYKTKKTTDYYFLLKINTKILKIPANQVHQHMKRHDLLQECKGGLTSENHLV